MSHISNPIMDAPGSPARIVSGYLEAFYRGNFPAARRLIAEDFAFRGPFLQVEGAEEFFAGAEGLRRIVRGHRPIRQWVNGAEVSTLYEVQLETSAGTGSVLMSEWDTVLDGTVASAWVVFDSGVFRKLVPQAGEGS